MDGGIVIKRVDKIFLGILGGLILVIWIAWACWKIGERLIIVVLLELTSMYPISIYSRQQS